MFSLIGQIVATTGRRVRSASSGPCALLMTLVFVVVGFVRVVDASPGVADINGNLNIGPLATIVMEVLAPSVPGATPVPGRDHDQFNVSGSVTFNGNLDIRLESEPVRPVIGTEYVLMTFSSASRGNFLTIDGLFYDHTFGFAPMFSETDFTIRASLPGDLNFDDAVNVADLSMFALNFQTLPGRGSWELGDFNTDGLVSTADLSLLALNFGADLNTGDAALGLSAHDLAAMVGIDAGAVPEPGVGVLAGCVGVVGLLRRRSSRLRS